MSLKLIILNFVSLTTQNYFGMKSIPTQTSVLMQMEKPAFLMLLYGVMFSLYLRVLSLLLEAWTGNLRQHCKMYKALYANLQL